MLVEVHRGLKGAGRGEPLGVGKHDTSSYKPAPGCNFTIWPFHLGVPAVGPFYEYRIAYSPTNARWEYFVNGTLKAAVTTNWSVADRIDAGDELAPPYNSTVEMGPNHLQQLQYRLTNNAWVQFFYHDSKHCDLTPPILPYNLIYPSSTPHWIYMWGPAAGGYCGAGGP
jgi:hypothetical protein